ncbi:pentapeptide repeat-containing protein (plasmid) [Streptomyces sp. A144]|uniref:pentapeptide repeat-containing protein n=1 Tax=Streptomyces sp. A144 TaxID=2871487 RepID=UPI001CBC8441|nr:pentapeptide repeat-containing protein [Streptomyces sp. A144]UAX58438.1 pentapeptide repeat-containing protein [Streptomyces sp. A144]
MTTSAPPLWPHCAHGADPAADSVGCRGIHVPGHTACLAHLADADRDAYLASLTAGASIDHRGTTFTSRLLNSLLRALRDPTTGQPRFGIAEFAGSTFESEVFFGESTFEGDASFGESTFERDAFFGEATFKRNTVFAEATFKGDAFFGESTFEGDASFRESTFERDASFGEATFEHNAWFKSATFKGDAFFGESTFKDAVFAESTFERDAFFGEATFEHNAWFKSATFERDAFFGEATFKDAVFAEATFKGEAFFGEATFKDAEFGKANFERDAFFREAIFEHDAVFGEATFERNAWFGSTIFKDDARFGETTFGGDADFGSATFGGDAKFQSATFGGDAKFQSATFGGDAKFESTTFVEADQFGPLMCAGRLVLSGATFGGPVTLSIAASRLECRRTRWSSTAEIRLRYATVDFAHAVFEYPLTIAAESEPFLLSDGRSLSEDLFPSAYDPGVRMASLRGVDAAHLVLADLDLWECLFTGTVHLDQLRLEGACTFNSAPSAVHWRRWPPVRFTERRVLAEEHHWRAGQPGAVPGWVLGTGRAGPLQLAPVYRALRKAFEDQKHEPGAADFYYGEMEMRRHADDIPRSERALLTAYWALSGYGLRASRALAWLGTAMLLTIVLLMAFGLAQETPKQTATGTVPAGGGKVTFEIDKDDPQNPTGDRFTGKRFEKALNVTFNSVVFRSSGQDLTTAGTYIEMTSRVAEPILLGLAVLAIRNRVKR